MKKNTGKKDSRDNAQAIVLVGNTYRRNVNPLPVIAVKLMLTYMLAVGTIMSFMDMYDIPFEFGSAIAQILLFVTAFMPIFILPFIFLQICVILVILHRVHFANIGRRVLYE